MVQEAFPAKDKAAGRRANGTGRPEPGPDPREQGHASGARYGAKRGEIPEGVRTSRLCVKNIPKYASEKRVKEYFSTIGDVHVTDVRILKTSEGKSRQFAFVGFKDEVQAERAKEYFDRAYFDTNRLSVSFALPFGDTRIGKAWSKHSKVNPATLKRPRDSAAGDEDDANKKKEKKEAANPKLAEFLKLMQPRSQSQFWANDDGRAGSNEKENSDSDSDSDDSDSENEAKEEEKKEASENVTTADKTSAERLGKEAPPVDLAADTGRLFIRNLSYDTTEESLEALFSPFGQTSEVHIPLDNSKRSRGFGYVEFMIPEHAVTALAATDGTIFEGRLIHVLPSLEKPEPKSTEDAFTSSSGPRMSEYKQKKEAERKEKAEDTKSWNALFIRSDAAVQAAADQLGVSKSDLLLGDNGGERENEDEHRAVTGSAVRMALSETRVIAEMKAFLAENGVNVDLLEQGVRKPGSVPRSKVSLLVKNLPAQSEVTQLRQMFAAFGDLVSFVMPPSKTMALVTYLTAKEAKKAFRGLAYKRYKQVPIYLEWAPEDVMGSSTTMKPLAEETKTAAPIPEHPLIVPTIEAASDGLAVDDVHTLFVKNLHFDTRDDALRKTFEKIVGKENVLTATIPKKTSSSGAELSLGYGFVEFANRDACKKALRKARGMMLDEHELDVKISRRKVDVEATNKKARKTTDAALGSSDSSEASKATKIVIRNLAFEANQKELKQLVSAYGQVNTIRMPRKFDGTHRGFAFVDFVTHQEARTAFSALANTHLYGRHLVIEWAQDTDSLEALREKASKQLNSR
eukprot:CAMPEP_0184526316 /NCGR_PEP_ID=MMETSP0198_2-20121128/10588_1 /TAXON_ID=1112570 /ORGANISM="Thraustochytrium sp., Strain LLF1b" /LENGTH=799 /DNA_ID=CAMNT_0026917877 /DNA_START=78 /DNA_END=2477 /DNA_ORIENTATION=-